VSPIHPWSRLFLSISLLLACSFPTFARQGGELHVDVERIARVIRQADRIVVFEVSAKGEQQIYASSCVEDRLELLAALSAVAPPDGSPSSSTGVAIVRLYRVGSELGSMEVHAGHSVRASIWASNGKVTDPERWLAWFDERGITGPRTAIEKRRPRAVTLAKARWR
jgi:hypothetical protein